MAEIERSLYEELITARTKATGERMAESYEQTELDKARDLAVYFFHCLIDDESISAEKAESWLAENPWLEPDGASGAVSSYKKRQEIRKRLEAVEASRRRFVG